MAVFKKVKSKILACVIAIVATVFVSSAVGAVDDVGDEGRRDFGEFNNLVYNVLMGMVPQPLHGRFLAVMGEAVSADLSGFEGIREVTISDPYIKCKMDFNFDTLSFTETCTFTGKGLNDPSSSLRVRDVLSPFVPEYLICKGTFQSTMSFANDSIKLYYPGSDGGTVSTDYSQIIPLVQDKRRCIYLLYRFWDFLSKHIGKPHSCVLL